MASLFLGMERILRIHRSLIEQYGGEGGIRDTSLLHSVIAMPKASYEGWYLHADIFEMAAAYLYHIVQNHPFVDGIKRTGAAAAIIFLVMNGIDVKAEEDGLVEVTLDIALGQAGKRDAADFLRSISPHFSPLTFNRPPSVV